MLRQAQIVFSKIDQHTKEVIKKAASSSLVKASGMLVGLAVSIFLGRTIGAEGLGIINLSNRVVTLIMILCLIGMRQVLIKKTAIGYSKKDWQVIGDSMYTAYWINGGVSIIVSFILILAAPWISNFIFNEPRLTIPLTIAIIAMTPQVFSRIISAGLIGYRKIWQSNLVDQTLSSIVLGLFIIVFWLFDFEITIVRVAIFYGIARIVVMLSISLYWSRLFQHKLTRKFIPRTLLKTSLPLLVVSTTNVVAANADIILLGWLGNTAQVGLYTVASRIAMLTGFFLQVTNSAISPKLAALFAEGKTKEMEKMMQRITLGLSVIAIIPLILFIFFGGTILSIWGLEFKDAYWILIILSIGQFFNIATGASGFLLIMCGYEKMQGYISIIFVAINLILNIFLIRIYGAIGAAIASAITVTGLNISRVIIAKIKINILSVPIKLRF